MANIGLPNWELGGPLPPDYKYKFGCITNMQSQVIPDCDSDTIINHKIVRERDSDGNVRASKIIGPDANVNWLYTPAPPTTVKHLYEPPNFPYGGNYPDRRMYVPENTLYGHQFTQTYPTGMGRQKVIGGGHYKVYPLTNMNVKQSIDYTSYHFPRPKWGTEYQTPNNGMLITQANYVRTDGWM